MIPVAHYTILSAILFGLGLVGILLNRRNVILLLICIELMLLAVNTNFVAFSHYYNGLAGQVVCFLYINRCSSGSLDWLGDSRVALSKSRQY